MHVALLHLRRWMAFHLGKGRPVSPASPSLFLLPECVSTKEAEGNLAWPWFFAGVVLLRAGSLLFLSFTFSVFRPLPRDVLMLGLFLLLENPSSSCFEAPFSWRCFCLCPYSFAGSAFSRLYLTLHPLPDRSHSRPRPLSLHGAHGLSHWEPLVHTLHPDISPTGRLHLHVLWV